MKAIFPDQTPSHPGRGHGSLTCHMTQFERSDWLRSENFTNIMIEYHSIHIILHRCICCLAKIDRVRPNQAISLEGLFTLSCNTRHDGDSSGMAIRNVRSDKVKVRTGDVIIQRFARLSLDMVITIQYRRFALPSYQDRGITTMKRHVYFL